MYKIGNKSINLTDIFSNLKAGIYNLKAGIYFVFAYLNINIEVFNILFIFMIVDSLFGVIKAIRLKYKIKFNLFFSGLMVKFLFIAIPLIVALLGKGLGKDLTFGVDFIMKLLIVSEAISVFGNMYSIKTKKKIEKFDFITLLIIALRKGLKTTLEKALNQIKNGITINNN